MKRNTVAFLFFIYTVIVILFYSCNFKNDDNNLVSIETEKRIDSLNGFYGLANNNNNTEEKRLAALDSFLEGAIKYNLDSLQYKGYILQTKLLNKYGYCQNAIDQSHLLLQLATRNKDSFYISKALYKLGLYNNKLDNYLKAFQYYNQSFKIRRNLKDSISAGNCLKAMSDIQRIIGDYNGSKTTATDGLKYLENSTEVRKIAGLYQNISIAFKELGNHDVALLWNTKIMSLLKDSVTLKKNRNSYCSYF